MYVAAHSKTLKVSKHIHARYLGVYARYPSVTIYTYTTFTSCMSISRNSVVMYVVSQFIRDKGTARSNIVRHYVVYSKS